MITAFTIGHSITLGLSALRYVNFSTKWIEFLVPVTIVITAAANLLVSNPEKQATKLPVIYFFALFFGLIHGLAYASTLMLEGEEGLVAHLFAFNVGIELAQLLVVAVVLLISFILVQLLKLSRRLWIRVASVIILMLALKMAYERFPNNKNEANAKASIVPVGRVSII